jgi:hypothetical protein
MSKPFAIFTPESEIVLFTLVSIFGNRWAPFCNVFRTLINAGMTENDLKNRYYSAARKIIRASDNRLSSNDAILLLTAYGRSLPGMTAFQTSSGKTEQFENLLVDLVSKRARTKHGIESLLQKAQQIIPDIQCNMSDSPLISWKKSSDNVTDANTIPGEVVAKHFITKLLKTVRPHIESYDQSQHLGIFGVESGSFLEEFNRTDEELQSMSEEYDKLHESIEASAPTLVGILTPLRSRRVPQDTNQQPDTITADESFKIVPAKRKMRSKRSPQRKKSGSTILDEELASLEDFSGSDDRDAARMLLSLTPGLQESPGRNQQDH